VSQSAKSQNHTDSAQVGLTITSGRTRRFSELEDRPASASKLAHYLGMPRRDLRRSLRRVDRTRAFCTSFPNLGDSRAVCWINSTNSVIVWSHVLPYITKWSPSRRLRPHRDMSSPARTPRSAVTDVALQLSEWRTGHTCSIEAIVYCACSRAECVGWFHRCKPAAVGTHDFATRMISFDPKRLERCQ
jgi:hypothetical protein